MADNLPVADGKTPTKKLRQRLYDQIKKDIITCRLPPGEQLNEGVIAERYHVSKTPVREALTSLHQSNLVEYRPNMGFFVTLITLKDIHEIFEARLFFECKLLELAVRHITPAEIAALDTSLEGPYDFNDPVSVDCCIQENMEFHLGIARASRNGRLYRHYSELMDEAQRMIYMDLVNNKVVATWKVSHRRVVDALRSRDTAAGIRAIEETMENGKKRVLGI